MLSFFIFLLLVAVGYTSVANEDKFKLCRELDEYGCSVQTIPTLLRFAIESSISGYVLPYDPCEFNTINVSWIWSQIDDIDFYISLFPISDYYTIPCYIIIQEPLKSRLSTVDPDQSYLVSDTYWFGNDSVQNNTVFDSTGQCDVYDLSNALNCNNETNQTFATQSEECLYPFIPSHYKRDFLEDYGLENCGLPCTREFWLFKGDLDALDSFTVASIIVGFIFCFGYAVNVVLELKHAFESFEEFLEKFESMPLTFDCTLFIALNLLGYLLVLAMPYVLGKSHFNCTDDGLLVSVLPQENVGCAVSAWSLFLFTHGCFWYVGLLSFSVFMTLYRPESPLFGINKVWYHVLLWTLLLALFIASVVEDAFGLSPPLGLCGPALAREEKTYPFVLVPLFVVTATFVFFTAGSVFLTVKHVFYEVKVGASAKVKNELVQLSIRLIIFEVLVGACCISFISVILSLLEDAPKANESIATYFACLVSLGDTDDTSSCKLEFTISNSAYYIEGILGLNIALACFALSCSTRKVDSWDNQRAKMTSFIGRKVTSKRGVERSRTGTNADLDASVTGMKVTRTERVEQTRDAENDATKDNIDGVEKMNRVTSVSVLSVSENLPKPSTLAMPVRSGSVTPQDPSTPTSQAGDYEMKSFGKMYS